MNHLDTSTIFDLIERRLSEPQAVEYKTHIDACLVCAGEYHFWWHFHTTIASECLVDASEQVIQRGINVFPGAPPETGLRQVIGQIIFDSFFAPSPALAMRGESDARQMVVHMEDVDVHLRITGKGSKQTIQGQILPRAEGTAIDGACITLLALGLSTQSTTSDSFGVFDFREVPKAPLIMSIKLQSNRFVGVLSVSESKTGG